MQTNGHTFGLVLYRDNGALLGYADLEPDWEPACQWVSFLAVRRGEAMPHASEVRVEPVQAVAGSPFLTGIRVVAEPAGRPWRTSFELPVAHFADLARDATTSLVADGTLQSGERFRYRVVALPAGHEAPPPRVAFSVEDASTLPPVGAAALGPLLGRSSRIGPEPDDEVPVFITRTTLDEIVGLARSAGATETGGALMGRLYRDATVPEVFVRVTGQLPARYTEATVARLRFTSDTWSALRDDLAHRGTDEIMLGWWHSHPVREWCRSAGCTQSTHDRCGVMSDCFSQDDRAVHRAIFPGAFSLALVANDVAPDDIRFSAFGWRRGGIAQRGLHVLPHSPDPQ
jgi:proteasome lid subunit RPN8/RPN11